MADMSSFTYKFKANGDAVQNNGTQKVSKRNRQPVSCAPCRVRKLKCDRGHPCESCVKRNDSHACSYAKSDASKPDITRQDAGKNAKAQDRLRHLEDLVLSLINVNDGSPVSSSAAAPPPESNGSQPSPLALNQGHMSLEGNESRYVGATHWSAILDNIQELRSVIVAEGPSDPDHADFAEGDTLFDAPRPPSLARVLQSLPSRVQVDRRLSTYFHSAYVVVPIIHTYQFQRQYEQFWTNPQGTSPLWISMLFSILCISATLSDRVGSESNTPQLEPSPKDTFITAAAQCLILGGYARPTRLAVESLLFFTQCKYIATLDPCREVGLIFSLLVRMSFRMGYHRDPVHFPNMTPFEGEMRRRVWATCTMFDLMVSFQIGLPSNVPEDSYDTASPSHLLDADFDEFSTELPPSRPDTEATQMLYFVVKSKMMAVFGKIYRHALAVKTVPESSMMELDKEIQEVYAAVPACLRIRPMAQSFADPPHLIMSRINCEFLFRKSVCVLHRKYMAQGNQYSRMACVTSAVAILKNLSDIHKEFQPGGQLHSDRAMLSSFTTNDFLLASMILCLALSLDKRSGHLDSNPEARDHLQLLHQAHLICRDLGSNAKEPRRVADALELMLPRLDPDFAVSQVPQSSPRPPHAQQKDMSLMPLTPSDDTSSRPACPTMTENEIGPFADLLDGSENIDWPSLDQYMMDHDPFDDINVNWTSSPVPAMGGPAFSRMPLLNRR